MDDESYTYKLFSRDDFSAFWALFTDNLINLIGAGRGMSVCL